MWSIGLIAFIRGRISQRSQTWGYQSNSPPPMSLCRFKVPFDRCSCVSFEAGKRLSQSYWCYNIEEGLFLGYELDVRYKPFRESRYAKRIFRCWNWANYDGQPVGSQKGWRWGWRVHQSTLMHGSETWQMLIIHWWEQRRIHIFLYIYFKKDG